MTSIYNFKKVQTVPSSSDFIDIVLSKTQRKTPTVIHKNYQISRIRNFYMRKVKFTQETFDEKLTQILTDFPKLDEIHPFYADLMNVLYDRDHYKLALGQINTCKHLIDNVGRDYVRLLKFGDSLYRCKQLKTAALGRMATIMKRQKETLAYLEQVRQHLARLPSIDPTTRTLLVCGYPNVGKSSFINKLTRAEVEVQPYAFTTKSLFVGHMDYKYLRWQVIDTPGILDHPLEERNTIEMLSITALAHLRACVLYFMDLTEQCGYSVVQQIQLFHNIKPLFASKPLVLVINKIDSRQIEDLNPEEQAMIQAIVDSGVGMVRTSCFSEVGLMDARNYACEKLLTQRVESKLRSGKVENVLQKIHVAQPMERDDRKRPAFIPEGAVARQKQVDAMEDDQRPKLARDIELANGGAGVFNVNLKDNYLLDREEWKQDVIPEIMDGHNIADFVDAEISAKLEALEREEEQLEAGGKYDLVIDDPDEETLAIRQLAKRVANKKALIIQKHRAAKGKNRPTVTLKTQTKMKTVGNMAAALNQVGLDSSRVMANESIRVGRKRARSTAPTDSAMHDRQMTGGEGAVERSMSRAVSRIRDRSEMGMRSVKQRTEAHNIKLKSQRGRNLAAKKGEGDRVVLASRPKHLFSGKRGNGTADHR